MSCADPEHLHQICDQLGPAAVQRFFDRWSARLPWPLTPADQTAGDQHRLSLWQVEVSLTQVLTRPVQGRHFCEAVIRENLDLGRPDRVSLLFPTRLTRRTPAPAQGYRTRVLTTGVTPSLHVEYKHSHVKQYFKEDRALRTETTINDPTDLALCKGLASLAHLRTVGDTINQKLLAVERVSHSCVLDQDVLDRLQQLADPPPRSGGLDRATGCAAASSPTGSRARRCRSRRPLGSGSAGAAFSLAPHSVGALTKLGSHVTVGWVVDG